MPNFMLPEGFEKPDGPEFEAVVTLTDNGDGTVTLTKIEGMVIEGYEDEAEAAPPASIMDRATDAGLDLRKLMA